jgi:hypothetical protein
MRFDVGMLDRDRYYLGELAVRWSPRSNRGRRLRDRTPPSRLVERVPTSLLCSRGLHRQTLALANPHFCHVRNSGRRLLRLLELSEVLNHRDDHSRNSSWTASLRFDTQSRGSRNKFLARAGRLKRAGHHLRRPFQVGLLHELQHQMFRRCDDACDMQCRRAL